MMRFPLKEKFEGVNSDGLTFEEFIIMDVRNNINSLLHQIDKVIKNKNDNELIIGSTSNTRFVLSSYYYKYLDEYVPGELANKLKREIDEKITEDELLRI